MIKTIKVTQKDIRLGLRQKARSCPVALAVQRTLKSEVMVTGAAIWTNGANGIDFKCSDDLRYWIHCFDMMAKVTPIKIILDSTKYTASLA